MPHVHGAAAGFAHHGEGLGQQVVERLALDQPLAELGGLGTKPLVRQLPQGRLEDVDFVDERTQTLEIAFVLGADDLGEECLDHLQRRANRRYLTIVTEHDGASKEDRP